MPERKTDSHAITCSAAEKEWLAMRCGKMAQAIRLIGPVSRNAYPDPFHALLHTIAGQQISSKAHESIWERILKNITPLTPLKLLEMDPASLRKCGVSSRKAGYMLAIAHAFATGELESAKLFQMTDSELSKILARLPGVGPWTVEMLQIFTFRRKNILSYGDLGIRNGLALLHDMEKIDRASFEYFKNLYSPCGTAASLYLWEIASRKIWPSFALRNETSV